MAKIKLKNPKKLAGAIIKLVIVIAVIITAVSVVKCLTGNSVKKDIEKLENQKVTIISKEIVPYKGDDVYTLTTLNPTDVITFRVVYTYQLNENKTIKKHPVETGIKVEASDAALAGILNNVVTIPQGVEKNANVTLKVSYSEDKSITKEFTYEIISDSTPPADQSGTDTAE